MLCFQTQREYIPMGSAGLYSKLITRVLQFFFGMILFCIFLHQVDEARHHDNAADSAWIYAAAVGALSWVTAAVFLVPCLNPFVIFWWDLLIFLLHAPVIGIFGKAYYVGNITAPPTKLQVVYTGPNYKTMRIVIWFAVASGIMWLLTGLFGLFLLLRLRRMCKQEEVV
jgi:hypothetical protein